MRSRNETFVQGQRIAVGDRIALILGEPEDGRSQTLAARARRLMGPDDAVVLVRPDAAPAWLDPEWLRGREMLEGAPTGYLCRGRVCSLPARTPDELEEAATTLGLFG